MTADLAQVASSHTLYRRFWHVLAGLLTIAPYALGWMSRKTFAIVLAGGLVCLLTVDLLRLYHPATNALFSRLFRPLLLPRDLVRLNGTTYYTAGVLLAVLLFPQRIAVTCVLFLILGDFAAGAVGRTWGRMRLTPEGKSLEGAAACFLVCLAVGAPFVGWGPAAAGAAAATVVEFLGLPVDDNLLIPPVAGAVLVWLT
jgi:dolichol kinase